MKTQSPVPYRGFSLIEILVAVSLLSLIVLGLVAMFGQTQRAFKTTLNDTDMQESGRAVSEMVGRELADATPFYISNAVNFFVEYPQQGEAIYTPPLKQALPGINPNNPQIRVNYLQPFYFLTKPNQCLLPDQTSVAIGYFVAPDSPKVGVGTLYRVAITNNIVTNSMWPIFAFTNTLQWANPLYLGVTNATFSAIAEGVLDLRVRPFAVNGYPIVGYGTPNGVTVYCTNPIVPYNPLLYRPVSYVTNRVNLTCPESYDRCWFASNAMPATVEVELGILEPQTYQQFKAIPTVNTLAQLTFLSNHVAQVHLFRQRIPIHGVDPSAYP